MKEYDNYLTSKTSIVSSNRVLYTPSSFARSSLLHLQECGSLTALKPHTSSREKLSSYLFFTVVSGEGSLAYGGREYKLKPGFCVFIDCRNPDSHSTEKHLWTISWCHFNGPAMGRVYDKYVERGGRPTFIPDSTDPFISTLADLLATARSSDNMRDMLINEQLSSLIRHIMTYSWHPEDKKAAPKRTSVFEVKEYLDQHYAEKIVLDELSSRFSLINIIWRRHLKANSAFQYQLISRVEG